jgi:hypothetical protein
MNIGLKLMAVSLLVLAGLVIALFDLRAHWLTPHGSVSCDGRAVAGASAYRSQSGDVFVFGADIQPAIISPKNGDLGRCNGGRAFTRIFGLVFSREAEPSMQCTSMWKGAGSEDRIPPHIVATTYAEFPWASCPMLRVEY